MEPDHRLNHYLNLQLALAAILNQEDYRYRLGRLYHCKRAVCYHEAISELLGSKFQILRAR